MRTHNLTFRTWCNNSKIAVKPDADVKTDDNDVRKNDVETGGDVSSRALCDTLRELGRVTFEKLLTEKDEEMEWNKFLLVNMEKTRTSLKVS